MHLVLCMICRENMETSRRQQRQPQRGRSQDTMADDKDRSRARTGVAGDDLQRSQTTPLPTAAAAERQAAGDRRGDQDRADQRGDSRRRRGPSGGGATPGGRESSGGEMSSLATAPALGGKGTGAGDRSSEHGARSAAGSAAAAAAAATGAAEGGALTAASAGKARPQSRRGEDAQRKEHGCPEESPRREEDSGAWRTGGEGRRE